ncbi:MAG TPA: xanthine dehydrogenase molybdopterin binding subunit [Phycisphaerae bacterium]|nr:xanthine dehydrogenase molybdopterin binding subunit [Phycisphaerae bacterium]
MGVVGKSIPHESAVGHVTGASQFIDDMPPLHRELIVDVVGSPIAHGRIVSIDIEAAEKIPGVARIFTARDIPGHNTFGPVAKDEHLLADQQVTFLGDPIVLIAAETREAMRAAKKAVKLTIDPLPPLFSIDDAIAADSFLTPERKLERGDVETVLSTAFQEQLHTLQRTLDIGGQDHFYLESHAALAVPGEGGTMHIHSSTQHPSEVQMIVAEVIGVPFNHVVCSCKRMGGGFGGKETQAAQPAAMAAVVAHLTGRPARIIYTKDDDMKFTGKRHPFKAFYKVAFDDNGCLHALDLRLFSNGGCTLDLSAPVLDRALFHIDNAYFIPNIRAIGRVCKTNLPSNTAFRGFGGPQGVAAIENIIQEIAQVLNKDAADIRRINCYGSETSPFAPHNLETPYGQTVQNNVLPKLLDQLAADANYTKRREEISTYNRSPAARTHLKGLALTPVKFGISFTNTMMNQANALVNVYLDGTVIVSTGATEMGQGVHTRIRQLVADDLGIPFHTVLVATTATDKNNNTSPSAASATTDLNGMAALDATTRLRARLAAVAAPVVAPPNMPPSPDTVLFQDGEVFDTRGSGPRSTFRDVVCRAHTQRVNLGERGFYATPNIHFDRDTFKGAPFLYFTNGAACAEVLIDRLTGDMKGLRVDLLMDAGVPINPGIDRGQIIGGFIQGMGWCTTEELKYSDTGALLSHSPTTYKIPNISDVPPIFNVNFFHNDQNHISIKRSKALGEPPLLLGLSVWAAVKDALSYAAGKNEIAPLSLPATNEQILMRLTKLKTPARPAPAPLQSTP